MSEDAESRADAKRRAGYHRRRQTVRAMVRQGALIHPESMETSALWQCLITHLWVATEEAGRGTNPAHWVECAKALEIARELQLRGVQLELPL